MGRHHSPLPYWERMPRFFLYPLRPPALFLVLGTGLLGSLLYQSGPLVLIGAIVILLLVAMRYGYEVLARTAEGEDAPPGLSAETLFHGYELPFKQLAILIVGGLVAALLQLPLPDGLAGAVSFAVFALMPASIMILAWTRSLTAALDPSALVQLVCALRWHYLALYGLMALTNSGPSQVLRLLDAQDSPQLVIFLIVSVQAFFTIMGFHLMGYFLYQFGDRLGLSTAWDAGDDEAMPGEDFSLVEQFMGERNYAAALAELQDIASRHPDDLTLLRRMHRAAQLAGDGKAVAATAERLIAAHAAAGRGGEAASVWLETLGHLPDYRPLCAEAYLPLVQTLRQRSELRQAVALANGFHQRFPDSGDVPALYCLVARIFREDLSQESRFLAIHRFLTARYPDHPAVAALRV